MKTRSQDQTETLKLLGAGRLPTPTQGPHVGLLEAFPNRFPQRPYIINLTFPEFTSLCPVTGQPDFGVISVEYIPHELCVESKSFKLYMFAYRNHQSFMETITNSVLDDLCTLLAPCWCRVKGLFAPRGGTSIHVFAEAFKPMAAEQDSLVRSTVTAWKAEARALLPGTLDRGGDAF
ncbi:MAG: NADPH-dependent 7-cyano-7-deazaguanine reductase QueF [Desulfovibrio sp.]|nr:NADPH-dependent 7-cyano-7-deazaguanine reductase QueF [Desulfovibrio sp.]